MEKFGEIIRADKPVLVDFYADWCGPCRAMDPVIRDIAKTVQGKARVLKINIDQDQRTAQAYAVQAVPTLILFSKGEIVWRHAGMIDKASMVNLLEKYS